MNSDEKCIIDLSKKNILNTSFTDIVEPTDWNSVFDKVREQNIVALIADSVLSLPNNLKPIYIGKWHNALIQTVYTMSKKNAEFERVVKLLSSAGITPLCLKGSVVKDLYPIPELRTMGDFDILVDADKRNKAEELLQENGYTIKKDTLFSEVDKNGVHGEIFSSLEDDFRIAPEYWDNEMKKNTYFKDNRLLLTPDYELAYSVIHAAKHLTREGCGIRNLFDVVVLLKNRDGIDLKVVEKICKLQGYENVLYYMITAAEHWYGIELNSDIKRMDIKATERFLEYLLRYGVFGRPIEGNVLTKQVARREGDEVTAFRRIFFPPRKMMWHKYQYLKKSHLLLPVAWVHRFITAVFVKKYSVVNMITGINESIDYGKDREKWLNELDIK